MNIRKVSSLLIGFALGASMLAAQVAVSPFKSPHVTFTDSNGVALVGGCVFTYAGGTSTPLATYTDSTGSTPNANPVALDVTGSANIWLGPSTYKFAIWSTGGTNCASGAQQWTVDQVPGNVFNNATVTGGTWTGGTITGAAVSGGTISGAAITTSTIDSTPIGQTTPSSGSFTSLASGFDAMSFSATPVFGAGSYGYFSMTLTNNVTSSSITGGTYGQQITFDLCQNATGQVVNGVTTGFTFAWPANMLNAPVVNPNLSSCTIAQAFWNGADWITTYSTSTLLAGNFDALSFSVSPIFQAGIYTNFSMTMAGNVSSGTITGGVQGQIITIDICQAATFPIDTTTLLATPYTLVWPTNLLYAPKLTSTVSTCTGVVAVYNGTNWVTVASQNPSTMTPLTGNLYAMGFDSTPTFDASTYSTFTMPLTGNVVSSTITGGTVGQLINLNLCQGSNVSPPASAPTTTTATTGGSIPNAVTYYGKCSYVYAIGTESTPSSEASQLTGSTSTNSITWTCPTGGSSVSSYKFYIGTASGSESFYFTSTTAIYTETGVPSSGTSGSPVSTSGYSMAWPANLLNAPAMSTSSNSCTGLIAVYNGTNWLTVATNSSLGAIQTNLTTSRSLSTISALYASPSTLVTYTAGTVPIQVEVTVQDTGTYSSCGPTGYIQAFVGSSSTNLIPRAASGETNVCNGIPFGITFIVPAGYTYAVGIYQHSMTATLQSWVETTF